MLRAFTFGQCVFETPLARIAPDSEVHFALLLHIVSAPADGVARDDVVARLWPHASGDDGRHCLRQAMYRLRQFAVPVQLSAGRIVLREATERLDLRDLLYGAPTNADLVHLGALPFLPSYEPALGEPFALWLEALRERVATRLRRALADEAIAARSRGRFHEMGRVARSLLSLDPLNEVGTMVLAESLALEGSKVEALRLLEAYEQEVGAVSGSLQLPVRVLRRRVSEVLDDSLMLRRFEVPFVGREREFAVLRTLWRETREGHARAVIVRGEAGIGKSRLAGELLRLAALDGASIASYTTSAGDTLTPISTLVAMGQQLLTLPGALGCDQEQLTYIRRLGAPETISAWSVAGMAADVLYAQLVHAFAELVAALAEEAPVVIFVDDAERLHPTTWRVLVDIWDRVGRRGVLFLLAARRLPPWFGSLGARSCERLTRHVTIDPLAPEDSREFLASWSARHDAAIEGDVAVQLAAASHGNPFYLSELAAHVGFGGNPEQTPATIAELIATQCRILSEAAQRVLLVVSVLESRSTTRRVTQLLEQPTAVFMAALAELEEGGVLATQGPIVRVRHRMIGEVAQSLVAPSVVDFAHGRAASILEAESDATGSVELLGDCVTHWERAGEMRRAFDAAMKLGYRLVGLGMGEEGEKAFERAQSLTQSKLDELGAIEGRMVSGFLAARWGRVTEMARHRQVLRAEISTPYKPFDEYELLVAESEFMSVNEMPSTERLSDLATQAYLPTPTRLRAALLLAIVADNTFDERLLQSAFDMASELEQQNMSLLSAQLRLIYHSTLGDRTQALQLLDAVARLARESHDYADRIVGMRRCAEAALRVADPYVAHQFAAESLSLATRLRLPAQIAETYLLIVRAQVAAQSLSDAKATAQLLRHLQAPRQSLAADAMIAWIDHDKPLMLSATSRLLAFAVPPAPRAEQTYLSILIAAALLETHEAPAENEFRKLRALHCSGSRFGGQDFSCSVMFASLRRNGHDVEAARMQDRYLRLKRRELYAPSDRLFLI